MRRQVSLLMTLTAWLLATGSHWDLVQTFAWGRMIAAYAESMPLAEAIKRTFTAENLCGVCEIVQDAKQGDDANSPTPGGRKLDQTVQLAFAPVPVVVVEAPRVTGWREIELTPPSAPPLVPQTPPPRAA